ncbi:MAG: hypothetical protein E7317_03140 [Clostridiales bacterium]|nr:hypothetical protein [Clostridiales bacterium]
MRHRRKCKMNRGRGAGARRRRQRDMRVLIAAIAAAVVILAVVIGVIAIRRGGTRDNVAQTAPAATEAVLVLNEESEQDAIMVIDTPEPTPEPTSEPEGSEYAGNSIYRPAAAEGLLPIFKSSSTEEKIVAVTLDDCYDAEALASIVDLCISNQAKITIFPIGDKVLDDSVGASLKYAYDNGFELENHTMTHNGLYRSSDEELAYEIFQQNASLSDLLGVEYQVHFLRPKGGDAREDQRIHAYCRQLGYYGIAHWSYSGTSHDLEDIKQSLAPGQIYLFHARTEDLAKLMEFIPYAISQGYTFVTLNEMFGYEPNETSALVTGRTVPPLEPYTAVPVTYKKTTYAYGAYLLQQKLIGLGYLTGEADGVYGADSANAVKTFQESVGLDPTGEADPETQAKIEELYALKFPNG